MASGWNLWVWLQCKGVASRCCYKEVYRYPHNNYYFSLLHLQARSQQFAKGGSTIDISAIDRTYIFIYMYIIYNYVAWYVNRTICMRI